MRANSAARKSPARCKPGEPGNRPANASEARNGSVSRGLVVVGKASGFGAVAGAARLGGVVAVIPSTTGATSGADWATGSARQPFNRKIKKTVETKDRIIRLPKFILRRLYG